MHSRALARLKKEYDDIEKNYGNLLELQLKDDTYMWWHIKFVGAENTVYAGETYTL